MVPKLFIEAFDLRPWVRFSFRGLPQVFREKGFGNTYIRDVQCMQLNCGFGVKTTGKCL